MTVSLHRPDEGFRLHRYPMSVDRLSPGGNFRYNLHPYSGERISIPTVFAWRPQSSSALSAFFFHNPPVKCLDVFVMDRCRQGGHEQRLPDAGIAFLRDFCFAPVFAGFFHFHVQAGIRDYPGIHPVRSSLYVPAFSVMLHFTGQNRAYFPAVIMKKIRQIFVNTVRWPPSHT